MSEKSKSGLGASKSKIGQSSNEILKSKNEIEGYEIRYFPKKTPKFNETKSRHTKSNRSIHLS